MTIIKELPSELLEISKKLPPFPAAAKKLHSLCNEDDINIYEITKVLTTDAVLSSKALKLSNSSLYGMSKQVNSPNDAVLILGIAAINSLATSNLLYALSDTLKNNSVLKSADFFKNSLEVACLCKNLASVYKTSPETAFCLGLLHDIASLLILSAKLPIETQENKLIHGVIPASLHAEIGASLANTWEFPTTLQEAILQQHNPEKNIFAQIIFDSCLLQKKLHKEDFSQEDLFCNEKIDNEKIEQIIEKTQKDISQFLEILQ